jgi:hypothetical protein
MSTISINLENIKDQAIAAVKYFVTASNVVPAIFEIVHVVCQVRVITEKTAIVCCRTDKGQGAGGNYMPLASRSREVAT